jgi:opacity protein-like surface antigen
MKKQLLLVTVFFAALAHALAGSVETRFVPDTATEKTALDLFNLDTSYVFESRLSLNDNNRFGEQDAFQFSVDYAHRFHLTGNIYLHAGVSYSRFDFGESGAPVPGQLQSLAGIIGFDYMVGNDVGAFLQVRPGFYTVEHFDSDTFDAPITLARIWILQEKKLYLLTGVNAAFLRGEYPVLPLVGLIWYPNDQWKVYAVVPEPRIVYLPNEHLGIWLGGQLAGGSFRTPRSDTIFPRRLSGAQLDYSEYRAGAGLDFHLTNSVTLSLAGGYAIERRFNFERAGIDFETDPAPYARVSFNAEF